ncbi:MAG: hypothetical protein Salg2KO_14730 [Salibacteraceae bacterium]
MTTITKKGEPTLNGAPIPVGAGDNFYVFYSFNFALGNYIGITSYAGGAWTKNTLVGNQYSGSAALVSNAPAPIANTKIRAVQVGAVTCLVYQSGASQLTIITETGPNTWELRTNCTPGGNINNFCLYTDTGNALYLLTHEGNTLYTQSLNGATLVNRRNINGQGGLVPNAHTPLDDTQLAAGFWNDYPHFIYASSQGIVDAYEGSTDNWTITFVEANAAAPLGIELFDYNNGAFETVCMLLTGSDGSIKLLQFYNGYASPWQNLGGSLPTLPTAASAASIGVNKFGAFAIYRDSSGNLQMLFNILPNTSWFYVQATGSPQALDGNAPAAVSKPIVGIYKNLGFHACYASSSHEVHDLYWFGIWNDASLYPTAPSLNENIFDTASIKDKTMME